MATAPVLEDVHPPIGVSAGTGAVTDTPASPTKAASRTATGASGITFDRVCVAYGKHVVIESLSLSVEPGEIMALIGPSGSGKTTALRAVAGFARPARGRVWIGDHDVTDLPPHARNIGMVVQNYALFPHMRVDENVAFGLRARRASEDVIKQRVAECLRLVGMQSFIHRYPRQLSGGQQQRVAIARALAIRPQVLLLDEPLSALDAQIRRSMLEELARLHQDLPSLTVLYVTHDQTEALTLADRIGIMRDGHLVAAGPSRELYHMPPNRFAAEFLGRANLLPVRLGRTDAGSGFVHVHLGDTELLAKAQSGLGVGTECLLCIRPHAVSLQPAGRPCNRLIGTVRAVQWQGDLHNITFEAHGALARMICTPLREPPQPGAAVEVYFAPEDATLIPEDAPRHG